MLFRKWGYSGSDVTACINGELIPELQNIIINEDFTTRTIEGQISLVEFGNGMPLKKYYDKTFDMDILFANEYGETKAYSIQGMSFDNLFVEEGINMICEEFKINYTARRWFVYPEFTMDIQKQIEYISENDEKEDAKTKNLIRIYTNNILKGLKKKDYVLIRRV